jgi:hypothetical protein
MNKDYLEEKPAWLGNTKRNLFGIISGIKEIIEMNDMELERITLEIDGMKLEILGKDK